MRKSLQALAYCHERGVAHGALGPSSLLLSTYEDARWEQLSLQLDNFGFARQSGTTSEGVLQQQAIHTPRACAWVCLAVQLTPPPPPPPPQACSQQPSLPAQPRPACCS